MTRPVSLALEEARRWLPIQNPLGAFVHNNPLQAYEQQEFFCGMEQAAFDYGIGFDQEDVFNLDVEPGARLFLSYRSTLYFQERHFEPTQAWLQDFVVPWISVSLGQAWSHWAPPFDSLWASFTSRVNHLPGWGAPWHETLKKRLERRLSALPGGPHDPAEDILAAELGERRLLFAEDPRYRGGDYLKEVLMSFKGWSGIVNRIEACPSLAPKDIQNVRLLDFAAALVLVENAVEEYLSAKHGISLSSVLPLGMRLGQKRWRRQQAERDEKWLAHLTEKLARSRTQWRLPPAAHAPEIQVLGCLDDREESLRRHLDEVLPEAETFGVLGSFGIALNLWHPQEGRPRRHYPPVISAEAEITLKNPADPRLSKGGEPNLRAQHQPWLTLPAEGLKSAIDMFRETCLPGWGKPPAHLDFLEATDLQGLEKFSVERRADIVAGVLGDSGCLQRLAPLVVLLSHGATTKGNPFHQAYGCGACGGNSGLINGRIFADFANQEEVREQLASRGCPIPSTVWFTSAHHDTTSDRIVWSSVPAPASHQPLLRKLQDALKSATARNARERLRLLDPGLQLTADDPEVPLGITEKRSRNLAEVRPEYGHTRVAAAFFGRRSTFNEGDWQGRAFFTSYDPDRDPKGTHLSSVLGNALPVCANISLDYFVSTISPERFGAGSKLPLNAVGLLGVMTGSKSDLRVGLAQQMTERHEAVRLVAVIEDHEERILRALQPLARVQALIRNEWIFAYALSPETGVLQRIKV